MPERIQQSRRKGARLPPNTVSVTRGRGRAFGNPFRVEDAHAAGYKSYSAANAVRDFRGWLDGSDSQWSGPESRAARAKLLERLPELRGKNLACFCALDAPCHASVLLELANA